MAIFVSHEPCPECGSRDNLGRYDDGSAYCFGCGHYERPTRRGTVRQESEEDTELEDFNTTDLTNEQLEWLASRGVGPELARLYFSGVYGSSRILFRCGPSFAELRAIDNSVPKSIQLGDKPNCYLKKENSCDIVIVEDILSAVVVSQVANAQCLFGSLVSNHLKKDIVNNCIANNRIVIWLDSNKYDAAIKLQRWFRAQINRPIIILCTPKDPKYYSVDEIHNFLSR